MAWRPRTVKLRLDRELLESVAQQMNVGPDPGALPAALRAHMECEHERKRLLRSIEKAAGEVLGLQGRYRELELRYETLLQENASLISKIRRLEENLTELRRIGHRG